MLCRRRSNAGACLPPRLPIFPGRDLHSTATYARPATRSASSSRHRVTAGGFLLQSSNSRFALRSSPAPRRHLPPMCLHSCCSTAPPLAPKSPPLLFSPAHWLPPPRVAWLFESQAPPPASSDCCPWRPVQLVSWMLRNRRLSHSWPSALRRQVLEAVPVLRAWLQWTGRSWRCRRSPVPLLLGAMASPPSICWPTIAS